MIRPLLWFAIAIACAGCLTRGPETPEPARRLDLLRVRYVHDRFVAVGAYGIGTELHDGVIAVSADGVHWDLTVMPDSGLLYDVAYGSGRWVAVGQRAFPTNDGPRSLEPVFISTDGASWRPAATRELRATGIAHAGGRFIAVGQGGAWQSADGDAWSRIDDGRWFGYYPEADAIGDDVFLYGQGGPGSRLAWIAADGRWREVTSPMDIIDVVIRDPAGAIWFSGRDFLPDDPGPDVPDEPDRVWVMHELADGQFEVVEQPPAELPVTDAVRIGDHFLGATPSSFAPFMITFRPFVTWGWRPIEADLLTTYGVEDAGLLAPVTADVDGLRVVATYGTLAVRPARSLAW